MSRTTQEVGMIAAGIGLALAAGPIGIEVFQSLQITNMMIGVGLTTALSGTVGLLTPGPQDPSNIGPQGQLPIQTPNPLWRIVYGIFQFAGAITFADGPRLDWVGTGSNQTCENQYIHRVHTLTCHQIAGFLAVVIDGQTFNFGTDLHLFTAAEQASGLGPAGMWGFDPINANNPYAGAVFFAFDSGDPGNASQPFPQLESGGLFANGIDVGSKRWTAACLQRGRAKVHVLIHYVPSNNQSVGPLNGAPVPYPLGTGRIPTIEFKIMGRIIQDPRVQTTWQPNTHYRDFNYVIAPGLNGTTPAPGCVFVQQIALGGTSGATAPNFAGCPIGSSVNDGPLTWLNCGPPIYAAGSGRTALNDPASNKVSSPENVLVADAWQGNTNQLSNAVIEAPIGYLQVREGGITSGTDRPNFATAVGVTVSDGTGQWRCIGRSIYATCLPDNDGTQNQGGFSNPALVIADYLQTPRNQFGLGVALNADSIATVIAAANICDAPTAIEVFADSTTLYERAYACNGCFESTSAYGDVLKSLALSMAGFVIPPGDTWRIYAGIYVPPTLTIADGELRGSIKGDFRLSARDTCNTVTGQFIPGFVPINPLGPLNSSPASPAWKKTDFPAVQVAAYINEDGGIILPKDIQLDFTISLWMAQRIARIVLERLRRQITVSAPAKLAALQVLAGDTLNFNHPNWETVSPPMPTVFQIAHLALRQDSGEEGVPNVGIDLVLRQTDAGVYTFNPPTSPTNYGDYSPYGQTGVGAGNVV